MSNLQGEPISPSTTANRIIQAAARIFASQGYARTTTRGIAAEANVTEVTLFRHFGSKQNLFAAVLDQYAITPDFEKLLSDKPGYGYHDDMLTIGNYIMSIMFERREAMRLMLCEAAHFPDLQEVLGQAPRKLRDMISSYLHKRILSGDVKARDPDMMAQAFLGFFFSYTMALGFLDDAMSLEAPPKDLVEGFVDLFVQGTVRN